MAAVSSSLISTTKPTFRFPSGSSLKPVDRCLGSARITNFSLSQHHIGKLGLSNPKQKLTIEAIYGDSGRPSSSSIFLSGFVLGGLIVGTLGCVYAPKISNALAGAADRKDRIIRKLPDFIYNEERALEKTRKNLSAKIEQLSSAIDDISSHLRSDDEEEGVVVEKAIDEVEAAAAVCG